MTESISIPGYRIIRKLGQGGMASVYLAIQESFDREVALKVMSPFLNSDPSFASRFLREARIVAQIHHSSIVPVVDVGQHEGLHYLSMEYLPSGDLKQRIEAGRHGANLALNVCVAISSALDLAHRKGFVHRDLKPENVLFREDGTPVLTDFGIARAIDAGDQQLTMAGTMVGTPNYMSPEQVKGGELDGRSDLYSLGVVFYEMLTGLVPFQGDSTMSLAMKHLSEPLPLLPVQFAIYQPFLDRLMAKEREDRFATGAEVIRALRLITDTAISRESTLLRNRAAQSPAGPEMPTLVSPNTGSLGIPPAASQPGTIRIPSTATQPSGIMQVPSMAARASGVHPIPPPIVPQTAVDPVPSSEAGETLIAPAAAAAAQLEDATVPRPSSHASAITTPAAQVTSEQATASPQARAPALLQKITGSKHSIWGAAAAIALLAIATGYLLGRTTESDPLPVTAGRSAAPPASEIKVADVTSPRPPETSGAADNAASPVPQDPSSGSASDATTAPSLPGQGAEIASAGADGAEQRTAEEAARRKEKEEREEEHKRQLADRAAAQKALAAAQQAKNLQAQRDREVRIKELLVQAKADIAQGHLVDPPDGNAWAHYREVLSKDPGQAEAEEARNGLKRIADVLVQEVDRAVATGNREIARQLIDTLRLVQADHPELSRLQARLQDEEPVKPLTRSQIAGLTRYLQQINDALDRSPQSLGTIKDALDAYDKAQRISNFANGLSIRRTRIEEAFVAATQTELGKGNTKQAREIIAIARGRGWLTADLLQVENGIAATQSP